MASGFSFMGKHTSTFGVSYIPDAGAMFDDQTDSDVYDDDMDWRDGGVFYGVNAKPKEFILDCFYEDLSELEYQKMRQWLDVGNEGKLIFDESPWKYYSVVLTKKATGKKYVHRYEESSRKLYSGTFTVTMMAYDPPYARMIYKYIEEIDTTGVSNSCGILNKSDMPAEPNVDNRDFLIYNCGLYNTPCIIRIGGIVDEDGLIIANETTGQKCRLVALPPSPAYLEIDSSSGSVNVIDPSASMNETAFEYHDLGYITLAPNKMIYDMLMINCTKGSNTVTTINVEANEDYVGKYILVSGQWMRIIHVDGYSMVLNGNVSSSGTQVVSPSVMNRITISGTATLDKLEVDWEPLVR